MLATGGTFTSGFGASYWNQMEKKTIPDNGMSEGLNISS